MYKNRGENARPHMP